MMLKTVRIFSISVKICYLNNTHYTESSTAPSTQESESTSEENTTEADTRITTQPDSTHLTEQPTQSNFFQKIIDFFVGIYNWIVNFFTSLTA